MFYLINHTDKKLEGYKEKISSSCRLLKESATHLVNAVGADNPEIAKIAKELFTNIEKLENESSNSQLQKAKPPKMISQYNISIESIVIDKFEAEANVLKKKRYMDVAQAEVDRLSNL